MQLKREQAGQDETRREVNLAEEEKGGSITQLATTSPGAGL